MNLLASLIEPFLRVVRDKPHAVLVREFPAGTQLDGVQLLECVESQAATLRGLGVGPGALVLVRCGNCAAFPVAILACWRVGACCVLADARSPEAQTMPFKTVFQPDALLTEASPPGRSGGMGRLRARRLPLSGQRSAEAPADSAVIKITSGSTGEPRGVVVTAAQLCAGGRQIIETMEINSADVNIGVIPMSHSYGFDNLILPLVLQGSPLALLRDPLPDRLSSILGMDESCIFPGVPYLFDLLQRSGTSPRRRGLRLCISAGAPLPLRVACALRERAGLEIHNFYGTTEAGGITFSREPAADLPEGCVGGPLRGVSLELEPVSPEAAACADTGRVVVYSAAVAQAYIPADASDAGPRRGRFATGDLGRLDTSGRLHLTGRLGSLVNVAGLKVSLEEVERTLRALASVRQAVTIAVRDEHRGQSLAACVEAEEGATRESVLGELARRLPRYKLPRRMVIVSALPRTARGKPDLPRIRRLLGVD